MNALDRASEFDRAYFEANPTVTVYVRDRVPGEWGPYEAEITAEATRVEQLAPGVRTREPVSIVGVAWTTS